MDLNIHPEPFEPTVSIDAEPTRAVLLLLHGIRDASSWWDDYRTVAGRFDSIQIAFAPVSYCVTGVPHVLLSIGDTKRASKVAERIDRVLRDFPDHDYAIMCHSNGTKVFVDLPLSLRQNFAWVFFVGSICHHDDDARLSELDAQVVNDCGTLDPMPVLAAMFRRRRFGHTGVVGFNNHPIVDRFFRYGHSGGKSAQHFEDHIISEIAGIKEIERRGQRPPGWMLLTPDYLRTMFAGLLIVIPLSLWWLG